ncbi:sensor histidine kinase [Dyella sp. A6]|uniref:sensor histidine kinase n=1 Tax=Dyella aluminiiresistens TaxID=3069105 RepID=UPI002E776C3D|nr:sensor histidine kinase [Dyella sp. A6]
MPAVPSALCRLLARWLSPAPDSLAAQSIRRGKSPWIDAVHLLWTVWIFITPAFDPSAWNLRWCLLTAFSYPVFLCLYAGNIVARRRVSRVYAIGMILLCQMLMPWYPSGLTYFVFGCVMLRVCGMSFRRYLASLLLADMLLLLEGWLLHYPWQATIMIASMTLIIGAIVNAERMSDEKDAELRLSHEEVRRLAATAERERIGRDLHDLLGHTLSLITLKLELSRKLFDRDPAAARREAEEAEQVARHALAEVRSAVTGIRATDLVAELASARLLLGSSQVHLDYGSPPPGLPAEVERSLALVLREAATNIARHAQAGRAQIEWTHQDSELLLCVSDDGRGGVAAEGNGLSGMRERVRALGGRLQIDSSRGRGTRLLIRVPCPVARADAVEASPPADVGTLAPGHAA